MEKSVWERIESSRRRWDVLRHPFYRRWSAGELTPEELARYSGQYRHAVVGVAELSERLAETLPERSELRAHAAEERAHVQVWDGFLAAAGGDPVAAPNAETQACVDAWTAPGDPLELLGRLYAIESGQPAISVTKRDGLLSSYGFDDGAGTAYFRVHASRDLEHAAEARELADELVGDDGAEALVAGAEAAFRANWRLLDGVYARVPRGDRVLGILLGLALGIAIVAIFVFVFSEDTVDAPSIDEAGAPVEAPAEP